MAHFAFSKDVRSAIQLTEDLKFLIEFCWFPLRTCVVLTVCSTAAPLLSEKLGHHIPTNSVAPFLWPDEGLMLETSVFKLQLVANLRYQLS